jgi:hypothetical protein
LRSRTGTPPAAVDSGIESATPSPPLKAAALASTMKQVGGVLGVNACALIGHALIARSVLR